MTAADSPAAEPKNASNAGTKSPVDSPSHGGDLALASVAVAHHQPSALLIPLARGGGQVVVDLSLQGGSQHPPGTLTHDLVQVQAQLGISAGVGGYTQHAAFLPRRRSPRRRSRTCHPGRYAALTSPDPIHNFRSYLALGPRRSLPPERPAQRRSGCRPGRRPAAPAAP